MVGVSTLGWGLPSEDSGDPEAVSTRDTEIRYDGNHDTREQGEK